VEKKGSHNHTIAARPSDGILKEGKRVTRGALGVKGRIKGWCIYPFMGDSEEVVQGSEIGNGTYKREVEIG